MATPYQSWLQQKGLTSTKANAARYRAQRRAQPLTYGAQVRRDPLSVPYDSEMVWQGQGRPNLQSLMKDGSHRFLTPVARPGGGWAVFGVDADPTPDWAKTQRQAISDRRDMAIGDANQRVAPWLANVTTALSNAQGAAQAGYANLVNQITTDAAAGASQAGVGGVHAGTAGLAPFQTRDALMDTMGVQGAQGQTAAAGYQAAVDSLSSSNVAQGLQGGLAAQIARMPGEWEQKRLDFEAQLAPILQQITDSQNQGEWQRQQALEQRRQFNAQNAIEREIAGVEAEQDQKQLEYDMAQDEYDAQVDEVERNNRKLAAIRGDLTQGQTLLDNQGQGFDQRPSIKNFHGRPVQWEQATNGKWYGVAGKKAGAGGGGGDGGENIYQSSTVRQRLAEELQGRWQGDEDNPGWSQLRASGVADAAARQVAQWLIGNQQFLKRGGKLRSADLRQFVQSVIPDVPFNRVRYYVEQLV